MYTAHVHFFTNLDLFCIDNARVIYRKIRYVGKMWNVSAAAGDKYYNHCAKESQGEILTDEWGTIIHIASFLIGPPRCIPGSRVRVCHCSCGALRR